MVKYLNHNEDGFKTVCGERIMYYLCKRGSKENCTNDREFFFSGWNDGCESIIWTEQGYNIRPTVSVLYSEIIYRIVLKT
jgi:hypothetical protein